MRLLCCTRCMMGKKKENNATGESCFLWLRFCRFNTFFCTSLRPNPLFPFLLLLTDSLRHKQKLGGQHLSSSSRPTVTFTSLPARHPAGPQTSRCTYPFHPITKPVTKITALEITTTPKPQETRTKPKSPLN